MALSASVERIWLVIAEMGWSATGGAGGGRSFGSRTNRLADVRLTAARRAATSSWERWYAGVSTHGVTALQPNECRSASRLSASLAASSGSSDASDHQPATTYVAASPATPLGASWATSSSGSWSANRCSTES